MEIENCQTVVRFGRQRKHCETVWWDTTAGIGAVVRVSAHIQNGDGGLEERRLLACPPVPHFAMKLAKSLSPRKINKIKIN